MIHRHQGVNIGRQGDLADECAIGANAVVNKDFLERGTTIAGIPAKKISDKGNPWIRHLKNN